MRTPGEHAKFTRRAQRHSSRNGRISPKIQSLMSIETQLLPEPSELFATDSEWLAICAAERDAQEKEDQALEAAIAACYREGTLEALRDAEAAAERAREALSDRQETISTPGWGSW